MHNDKLNNAIKNISFSFLSNIIILITSALLVMILPRYTSMATYGYYQLYLFYISMMGWIHLGWIDGVYLRYSGVDYGYLETNKIIMQFWLLSIYMFVIFMIITYIGSEFLNPISYKVLLFSSLAQFIMLLRALLLNVLQITNRIRSYVMIGVLERATLVVILFLVLYMGYREYYILIFIDVAAKLFSLLFAVMQCKNIVFGRYYCFRFGIKEVFENIKAGSCLLVAGMVNVIILGIARWGICHEWNIETFAGISLAFNLSNFFMIFINAMSVVLFPIIKDTKNNQLGSYYKIIRNFIMTIILGAIVIVFPMKYILIAWLPNYSSYYEYIIVVFPICVFESKVSLLTNTYYKSLRKEKIMLKIGIFIVFITGISTLTTVFIYKSLNMVMFSILFLFACKSIISEVCLSKIIELSLLKDIFYELFLVGSFVFINLYIQNWYGGFIYCIFYCIYFYLKRKEIVFAFKKVLVSKI